MDAELTDQELSGLSDLVAERIGLHLPPLRWPDLRRAIAATARTLGVDSNAFARQVLDGTSTAAEFDALAENLTVGETYFFREPRCLEILAERVLGPIVADRRTRGRFLRIWSAGCCTGEEPYSIAITLRRTIPDVDSWNLALLATDINAQFLRRAEAGIFGSWSFRDAPPWLREQYFHPRPGGRFEILPEVRRMVRFERLNLAADVYPSPLNDTNAMDVIFCRNVLMYLTDATAKHVIDHLSRSQAEGGWLFVGASELPYLAKTAYAPTAYPHAIVFRKQIAGPGKLENLESIVDILRNHPATPVEPPRENRGQSKLRIAQQTAEGADAPAAVLYKAGRYREAIELLENTLAGNGGDIAALELLAHCLANAGQLADALQACQTWIAADKLNPRAHYLKALLLQEQGSIDEATAALRAALFVDPDFALAHVAIGAIDRAAGRTVEARRHFQNALSVLRRRPADEILCESDGIRAGRLAEIARELAEMESAV